MLGAWEKFYESAFSGKGPFKTTPQTGLINQRPALNDQEAKCYALHEFPRLDMIEPQCGCFDCSLVGLFVWFLLFCFLVGWSVGWSVGWLLACLVGWWVVSRETRRNTSLPTQVGPAASPISPPPKLVGFPVGLPINHRKTRYPHKKVRRSAISSASCGMARWSPVTFTAGRLPSSELVKPKADTRRNVHLSQNLA